MKSIYAFEDADSKNKMLLGGKGAGLSEMTRLKLPVPPGFTITCLLYTSPSPRDRTRSRMPSSA